MLLAIRSLYNIPTQKSTYVEHSIESAAHKHSVFFFCMYCKLQQGHYDVPSVNLSLHVLRPAAQIFPFLVNLVNLVIANVEYCNKISKISPAAAHYLFLGLFLDLLQESYKVSRSPISPYSVDS